MDETRVDETLTVLRRSAPQVAVVAVLARQTSVTGVARLPTSTAATAEASAPGLIARPALRIVMSVHRLVGMAGFRVERRLILKEAEGGRMPADAEGPTVRSPESWGS